jgi:hypothetical protein
MWEVIKDIASMAFLGMLGWVILLFIIYWAGCLRQERVILKKVSEIIDETIASTDSIAEKGRKLRKIMEDAQVKVEKYKKSIWNPWDDSQGPMH